MKIIDMHAHAFPDALAPRAVAALESPQWRAVGDGTIAGLLRSMDAAHIDSSVICNIATKPSQAEPILKWSREIASDRILPFGSVHPTTPDIGGWVGRFADAGFKGIKMHPMYQAFDIDEERMDPFYAAMVEASLLLEIHCGYDIAFPGDHRGDVDRIVRVLERHPSLRLILTHMGAWQQWDQAREHLIGRDIWVETSMSMSLMGTKAAAELILQHAPDKMMFGTDWPWTHQTDQINLLHALPLAQERKAAILGTNAAKLLGL